ncbi:MAG: tetratricopeptide repeat protein [bacterium]|nr:tetratricopeptide repeat protein [bacterium]
MMFKRILMVITLLLALCQCGCSSSVELPEELRNFDKLWNYGDPAGTEAALRELLPKAEQCGDSEVHVCLLTQIARAQGLQGDFDGAAATLDDARALMGQEDHLGQVRILLEQGRVLNSSGKREESIPLFLEALNVAQTNGHEFHAVDAAHMLGIVEESGRAMEWNLKAITMAEEATDERAGKWLGALYNNTGWTLHDQGLFADALDLFERALVWRRTNSGEVEIRIAKWSVARALRSLERTEEALAMQRELLTEIETAGADQDGYVFEELGECLLLLERVDEARPHFAKAWELLSQDSWLVANEQPRLDRLKELGGK